LKCGDTRVLEFAKHYADNKENIVIYEDILVKQHIDCLVAELFLA
jgi:hypothetical protein